MKYKIIALLMFFVLFAGISSKISAQTKPFTVGEVLTYEGKVSKIIQGIAVADMTFTFTNAPESNDYLIKTEAKSKGSLLKLFRYSFLQQYESIVDKQNFRILRTVKHDEQKERIRDSEAVFDYESKQVTFSEINPKDLMRPPRKIASEIKTEVHDMVSGIYALRLLPLAVGKVFEIAVSDSGLVYKVPVRITRREIQKTILGKVMCFRVEPEVFGINRLIEQEGSMIIWITDDARRIPVRSQIKSNIGKIEVKLKQATNTTPKK
ncbi:MAG TPA: DUF3108 domain-containing protein [Pyrinomonadaceae bacterium]|jgi:hypothetical protein|nr:DUF3108 domain-containing protein [Pyrinomonadaceae bacterium]